MNDAVPDRPNKGADDDASAEAGRIWINGTIAGGRERPMAKQSGMAAKPANTASGHLPR